MITLDVDPQATMPVARPMPDEVTIAICDADGARCWIKMSKKLFDDCMGSNWLAQLEDGVTRLREKNPDGAGAEWALDMATIDARNAKYGIKVP
jgi:hypothetical protein